MKVNYVKQHFLCYYIDSIFAHEPITYFCNLVKLEDIRVSTYIFTNKIDKEKFNKGGFLPYEYNS